MLLKGQMWLDHNSHVEPRSSEMESEPRRVIVGHHGRVLRTIDPVVRASRRTHATARPSGAGASLTCERGRWSHKMWEAPVKVQQCWIGCARTIGGRVWPGR